MPFYKILKTGYFSEEWLNKIGDVVDLHPDTAKPAVEKGYLEEAKKKVVLKPVKKKGRPKKK